MKVSVEKDLCIGCGLCESACPDVFEMKENIATVETGLIPAEMSSPVKQMAKDCPVEAIRIEE